MTVGTLDPELFGYRDLVRAPDGLYYDPLGTVWALQEFTPGSDPIIEIGIGHLWALSPNHPWTNAARFHDLAYSSPAYQKFHTRLEADTKLYHDLLSVGAPQSVALLFYGIVRVVGGTFWDNPETR